MLIEMHMIQNHSPANLNRDDLGAPKTCLFGGVTRARISSQCLKRSIRRSPEFSAALQRDGGVRTRRLIEEIARAAADNGKEPDANVISAVRSAFEESGVPVKNDGKTFDILFFLPRSAIHEMGEAVRMKVDDLGSRFAEIIGKFVKTPDIALFGRMTEFEAKGPFKDLKGKFTVEAALSASHAISTHEVVTEVDYFTAADDIPGSDAGAGHVNEAMFMSACFYKHFVIDWKQLVTNLNNDRDLARTTVECFLKAAVKANPSGKQHSFAAFNPPDGVLVELKENSPTPISYANAFADPVNPRSPRGLVGESIARLGQYANDLNGSYGIEAQRFWFSPNLRYHLTYVDKSKREHEQVQPVTDEEFGKLDAFVNRIMDRLQKIMGSDGASA